MASFLRRTSRHRREKPDDNVKQRHSSVPSLPDTVPDFANDLITLAPDSRPTPSPPNAAQLDGDDVPRNSIRNSMHGSIRSSANLLKTFQESISPPSQRTTPTVEYQPKTQPNDTDRSLRCFEDPPHLDVRALTLSALSAFALLEPWYLAEFSTDHPLLVDFVKSVRQQGDMYCSAIADSLETATHGVTFAEDCIDLCDAIGRTHSAGKLTRFTESMLDIASHAHEAALGTQEKFRSVRSALMGLRRDIPDIKYSVLALPDPLSQDSLSKSLEEMRCDLQAQNRRTEAKSVDAIKDQLDRAQVDLGKLIDLVGHFVVWWGTLIMDLKGLETVIPLIDTSNPLRLESTRKRWSHVRDENFLYAHKITVIEDRYPQLRRKTTNPATSTSRPSHRLGFWDRLKDFFENPFA